MSLIFSGGGLSSDEKDVLDKLSYDEPTDTVIADASLQVKPSTVYLGSSFGMSNAVQAVGFRLADGTDALCMVNRFNQNDGSISNPKFFALGQSSMLDVNLIDSTVMSEPIEVSYTTAGDNLTYSFQIKPASAGRLRAQYWLGSDDKGAPVVDFHRDITQTEVDSNQPVLVEPNFYVLAGGGQLFVRFSGVQLKGNGTLPYFRSKILPYKEITIGGHVITLSTNQDIFVGCEYGVDTNANAVVLTVPVGFKDKFRVFDLRGYFNRYTCTVSFMAFNQGTVEMTNKGDDIEFFYVDGDGWWLRDNQAKKTQRV